MKQGERCYGWNRNVVVETKPKLQTNGNVLNALALAAGYFVDQEGQAMSIFRPC